LREDNAIEKRRQRQEKRETLTLYYYSPAAEKNGWRLSLHVYCMSRRSGTDRRRQRH